MWILLERSPSAVKLKVDLSKVKDLNDFKCIFKRKFEDINLKFLSNNSTDKNSLAVCYLLTNANIVVNYSYEYKHSSSKISYTSDSLNLLKEVIKKKYENLKTKEFYFLNDKIEIRNDKWDLKDVFKKILKKLNYEYLSDILRFNLNRLPSLILPFTKDKLKKFVKELQQALNALNNECDNKSMACLYINAFIKFTVCYIKDHINESTQLCVEKQLDGSYRYGPVDYMVKLTEILMLLCKVKSENMNKEVVQVVVQMQRKFGFISGKIVLCTESKTSMGCDISASLILTFDKSSGPKKLEISVLYVLPLAKCFLCVLMIGILHQEH
ncbi:hypothetical protein Glove_487g56 [Diversispora epigaea]|uniref:Uncharacterized protein n=1 Tax=Diversispora epigaea TaxID=1348612 RepID=A0A397GK98_9GLOM|nr:hypothetical protein Glove_487g56 [Diversispora epigaea]